MARHLLERGTVLCSECGSVPNEPCRENDQTLGRWAFRLAIHATRRKTQILSMPESIDLLVAGRLIGMNPDATRAAVEEGTFPLPITMVGRRRTVPRTAVLRAAMRAHIRSVQRSWRS